MSNMAQGVSDGIPSDIIDQALLDATQRQVPVCACRLGDSNAAAFTFNVQPFQPLSSLGMSTTKPTFL